MRNFRFDPNKFGGVILLIESKITPPNGSCAQDAEGTGNFVIFFFCNFGFVPQVFGGVVLLFMSKITLQYGSCAQDAEGIVWA